LSKHRESDLQVILDRFVEGLFLMMLEHHRTHVVELDLTVVQAHALMALRSGASSTTALASLLSISAPAVTQLTDRLVRKHLIERLPVKTDRRAVAVALTAGGRRVVDAFRRRRYEVFARALDRLSQEDRLYVIEALNKVADVLSLGVPTVPVATGKNANKSVIETEPVGLRTALELPQASKRVGDAPVGPPTKRMRIEWD